MRRDIYNKAEAVFQKSVNSVAIKHGSVYLSGPTC